MYDDTTPVLVVGGGLVGLSTSLFLSAHGVPNVLVERHPGTSVHPRAWGLYPRTLELFDAVGATDDLLREAEGFAGHVLNGKVESLTGREISVTRIPEPDDVSGISPVARILSLSQDRIEPILLRHAERLGGDLRFGTELLELAQDATGVTARVRERESGAERTVRARYVVAADGAHSPVRERLGIRRHGRGTLRHQVSIVFHADLRAALGERRFAICRIANAEVDGVFGHDDTLRRGTLIVTRDPETTPLESYTPERCTALVRAAVGVPDLPVEIHSALPWEMAALVAERFSADRIFLAGDAAHVIPPVGGYGANTGIQDAHNLAWKLAAVLAGEAGPALLDTYDTERRPVATSTMRQAGLRLAARAGAGPGGRPGGAGGPGGAPGRPGGAPGGPGGAAGGAPGGPKMPVADTLSVMFGYRYRSAAVVAGDGTGSGAEAAEAGAGATEAAAGAPDFADPRALDGTPGTRVPHVPLERDGRTVSTVALPGRRPLLLAGAKAVEWHGAALDLAHGAGLPLDALRIGSDLTCAEEGTDWHETVGVSETGAVLLRPDGFVAWRAEAAEPSPQTVLAEVLGQVLARGELPVSAGA